MAEITGSAAYNGIYGMHKYWGKKPFNVISAFIEKYSAPGDIVLDSFCGSGITLIESLKLNRKAIGIDLNPLAVKLTTASVTTIDLQLLQTEFAAIKQELEPLINSLYATTCETCGQIACQTHVIWANEFPAEVWYKCDWCKPKKQVRAGTICDKNQAENPHLAPLWIPNVTMFENSRINVRREQTVADLFTRRAVVALSHILDRIKKIENPLVREALALTFTGAVSQASKLVFVIRRRNKNSLLAEDEKQRPQVGSWVVGYWIPEEHFEIHAWNCFENRFRRIFQGKEKINATFPAVINLFDNYNDLIANNQGAIIWQGSATKLNLPDNSIDYVFIDPPHGNRILYLEMSLLWNAWLNVNDSCDWDNEIIVSEAKARNKSVTAYTTLMNTALLEIKRVLKPNQYFSLAFNSLNDETWLSMLNICTSTGFHVVDIQPLAYSATSVVQDNRPNALKTDFVITCQKNNDLAPAKISMNNNQAELLADLTILLENTHRETYDIINNLFQASIYKGFIYPPTKIVAALTKNFSYSTWKWSMPG